MKPGFGARLRDERIRLGLSQQDFAERAGIKRASQYLYEKGQGSPNHRYLMAIAPLGVDIHYLLFGEHHDPAELCFTINTLKDIFAAVDEICRDRADKPLPMEARIDFFTTLCIAYSRRKDEQVDIGTIKAMFNK